MADVDRIATCAYRATCGACPHRRACALATVIDAADALTSAELVTLLAALRGRMRALMLEAVDA